MEKHLPTLDPPQWGVSFNTDILTDNQAVCIIQEWQQRDSKRPSYRKLQQLQEVVKTANGCSAQRVAGQEKELKNENLGFTT